MYEWKVGHILFNWYGQWTCCPSHRVFLFYALTVSLSCLHNGILSQKSDYREALLASQLLSTISIQSRHLLILHTLPLKSYLYVHSVPKLLRVPLTRSLPPYLHPSGKMLQDDDGRYRGLLSYEERGQAGGLGPYQESLVSLTQHCGLMCNILGPSCNFLRNSLVNSRQTVRKSGHTQTLPFLSIL